MGINWTNGELLYGLHMGKRFVMHSTEHHYYSFKLIRREAEYEKDLSCRR